MTDAEYFAWLEEQTDVKIIIKAMLENWSMFCGDGYYKDWHAAFEHKLEQIVEGERRRTSLEVSVDPDAHV